MTTLSRDDTNALALMAMVLIFISTPVLGLWYAFAAATMWHWFAVPFGAPAVSLAPAYGLLLLWTLLTRHLAPRPVEHNLSLTDILKRLYGQGIGVPAASLAIGWVVRWWWLR